MSLAVLLLHCAFMVFDESCSWFENEIFNMDRGLTKMCNLPMFTSKFIALLMGLNITTVEFIAAFPSTSGVEFSHAVLDLSLIHI